MREVELILGGYSVTASGMKKMTMSVCTKEETALKDTASNSPRPLTWSHLWAAEMGMKRGEAEAVETDT